MLVFFWETYIPTLWQYWLLVSCLADCSVKGKKEKIKRKKTKKETTIV
jgi:hypothetical protein